MVISVVWSGTFVDLDVLLLFIANFEPLGSSGDGDTIGASKGTISRAGSIRCAGSAKLYSECQEVVMAVVTVGPLATGARRSVVVGLSFGARVASIFCCANSTSRECGRDWGTMLDLGETRDGGVWLLDPTGDWMLLLVFGESLLELDTLDFSCANMDSLLTTGGLPDEEVVGDLAFSCANKESLLTLPDVFPVEDVVAGIDGLWGDGWTGSGTEFALERLMICIRGVGVCDLSESALSDATALSRPSAPRASSTIRLAIDDIPDDVDE